MTKIAPLSAERTILEGIRERDAAQSCAHCGVLLNRGQPHAPYCIGRVKHGPCDVCDSLRALTEKETPHA